MPINQIIGTFGDAFFSISVSDRLVTVLNILEGTTHGMNQFSKIQEISPKSMRQASSPKHVTKGQMACCPLLLDLSTDGAIEIFGIEATLLPLHSQPCPSPHLP